MSCKPSSETGTHAAVPTPAESESRSDARRRRRPAKRRSSAGLLPACQRGARRRPAQRRAASPGVPAGRAVVEHEHVGGNPTGTRERELCVDAKDFLVEFDPQRRLQMLCQYRIIVCRFYGGAFNGKRTCGDSTDVYMLFSAYFMLMFHKQVLVLSDVIGIASNI